VIYDVPPPLTESESHKADYLFNYHSAKLTFGLVLEDIKDAIREGDGDRLMDLALPIYYSHGRTKYQYTTLLLLVKKEALLSKLQAFRFKGSRFCNTRGKEGHNISLDLRLEQFNNLLKAFFKVLGSNLSQSNAQRVACCLDVLEAMLESIEVKQRQCKNKAESALQIVMDLVEKEAGKVTTHFLSSMETSFLNSITGISSNGFKTNLKIWEKMYEK